MVRDEFQLRGNECTKAPGAIRFVRNLPFGVTCTYQRSTAVIGSFTTGEGTTVLSISKQEFILLDGGFGCPGATYIDWSFNLETDEVGTRLGLI